MKGQGTIEFGLVMVGIVIVLALALLAAGPMIANLQAALPDQAGTIELPDTWADVPLSYHAQEAHAGQLYNARTIPGMIDQGKCIKITASYCPDGSVHLVCEVEPEVWVGLLWGVDSKLIITGFQGSFQYWRKDAQGCSNIYMPGGFAW